MKDPFALLGVPRRPWIDAETLKQRFLSLSSECHPDRTHQAASAEKKAAQDRFTELNAAYQTLLDPRERLRALLQQEAGKHASDVQTIPPGLMNLFVEAGKVCREADAFLAKKAAQTSPLLKVQLFEQAQNWIDELRGVRDQVTQSHQTLLDEIKKLDSGWETLSVEEKESRLGRLQEIAGLLNYPKKWNARLEEKIVQLSF